MITFLLLKILFLGRLKQFRGRRLQIFNDGWYTSIKLSEELAKLGFLETTLYKSNTAGLPSKIKSGEEEIAFTSKVMVNLYHDKKNILFATNYYDNLTNIRDDYNLYNRGVDRINQNMPYYSEYRKEFSRWKKIFLLMIGVSCENSRILYNFLHPTNARNNFDFRKEL